MTYPAMRICRFSGPAWELGVEDHVVEGVSIKVYSVAKTIVDLFKSFPGKGRFFIVVDFGVEKISCLKRKDSTCLIQNHGQPLLSSSPN